MVVTIVVIVGIVVIGVGILAYRNRTEKGIESGITSFRRELHALAPRPGEESRAAGGRLADEGSATETDSEIEHDSDTSPETETETETDTSTETETDTSTEADTDAEPSERPDA